MLMASAQCRYWGDATQSFTPLPHFIAFPSRRPVLCLAAWSQSVGLRPTEPALKPELPLSQTVVPAPAPSSSEAQG
jgi:hypothetical protein